MHLLEQLKKKQAKIAVVGLGYVGLPIAVAFARQISVIGYDINKEKISQLQAGIDIMNQVEDFTHLNIEFNSNPKVLKEAQVMIVAVPTQINKDGTPNLTLLEQASISVGQALSKDDVVIYESTVYPGTTEEICIPILERESGLKYGEDFKVCYSPERINPSDKQHSLCHIDKLIAADEESSLDFIEGLYQIIIEAKLHRISSIKVAEASKIVENSQRDVNIAFMNEVARMCNALDINIWEVLEAAKTKWNFLSFKPGLVGGECIGVDPYYLIYKAKQKGYTSKILEASRNINEYMPLYIVDQIVREMVKIGQDVTCSKVLIMGLSFKENCPDVKNSKVLDMIEAFEEWGIQPFIYDPIVHVEDTYKKYGIKILNKNDLRKMDVVVYAVAHDEFKLQIEESLGTILEKSECETKLVWDIKGLFDNATITKMGYHYKSL